MSMTIGTNMASLVAQRSLNESGRDMGVAMERLATGSKINSAADDAAGLALSSRMAGQISGLNAASKNITDGIALTDAIEGSLDEVGDILQRMRGLAVQSASDTTAGADRTVLNNEMTALKNELTAMSSRTQFAGQNILDGSFSGKLVQVGDTANETISITQNSVAAASIGAFTLTSATLATGKHTTSDADAQANTRSGGHFTITANGTTTGNIGDASTDTAKNVAAEVNALTGTTGVTATAITRAKIELTANAQTFTLNGVALSFTPSDDATVLSAINEVTAQTGVVASVMSGTRMYMLTDADGDDIKIEETADQVFKLSTVNNSLAASSEQTIQDSGTEFGVVAGHLTLTSDKEFSTTETTIGYFDTGTAQDSFLSTATLDTQTNANSAISIIDGAISRVSSMRADLGAIANRLEHAFDSTVMLRDSTENARAAIVDTDYSKESAALAKNQVLQQVGTAMLAQANAAPQLVLQLIQ
jgi:flagellin